MHAAGHVGAGHGPGQPGVGAVDHQLVGGEAQGLAPLHHQGGFLVDPGDVVDRLQRRGAIPLDLDRRHHRAGNADAAGMGDLEVGQHGFAVQRLELGLVAERRVAHR